MRYARRSAFPQLCLTAALHVYCLHSVERMDGLNVKDHDHIQGERAMLVLEGGIALDTHAKQSIKDRLKSAGLVILSEILCENGLRNKVASISRCVAFRPGY